MVGNFVFRLHKEIVHVNDHVPMQVADLVEKKNVASSYQLLLLWHHLSKLIFRRRFMQSR